MVEEREIVPQLDTPSVTIVIRATQTEVAATCIEFPEWNSRGPTLSAAVYSLADKAQAQFQDPFAQGAWDPIIQLRADRLPPLLTIRLTWSCQSWSYVVKVDERRDLRIVGPLDTLRGTLLATVDHLSLAISREGGAS